MYKRLLVVSDTAICKVNEQTFGFGAVVKELEQIQNHFEEIIWIGTHTPALWGNETLIEVQSSKIRTILIPQMGGKSFLQVLKILALYPYLLWLVATYVGKAQVIHTRAPSHPAFVALLVSFLVPSKIWWHKFAGSWNEASLPFFYKLQRKVLLKAKHAKVTINGSWPNQPQHCHTFENPCLTQDQVQQGGMVRESKNFSEKFNLVFIGRLDDAKGVSIILEALAQIPLEHLRNMHFVGDGSNKRFFENKAAFLKEKAVFHGFLPTEKVHKLLTTAHFLLLPSKSEGFPKVIAEAACYGVIPVVSNVGSITHYLNDTHGFIWNPQAATSYAAVLQTAFTTPAARLHLMAKKLGDIAQLFTFEQYMHKLKQHIFHD